MLIKSPELKPSAQQALRSQTISELTPGSLLHDFAALLDFVATRELTATGKQQLLPLAALEELNSQMAQPLNLGLKRAVQKSYPHINGLFLLARATGLLRVVRHDETLLWRLDETALSVWQSLNHTEQYFTLLEAYLYHASVEMIGERGRWLNTLGLLGDCLMVWQRIGEQGIRVPPGKKQDGYINSAWLYHFALLELFGLTHVKPGEAQASTGWSIAEIQQTPFGQALMTLVLICAAESLNRLMEIDLEEEETPPHSFTKLQAQFQAYFPDWQRGFALAKQETFQEGVFQFKVSLGKIWRRIITPATTTLDELSDAILESVNFDNDHLHCFEYKDRFGVTVRVNYDAMEEPPYSSEVRVGELPLAPGSTLKYTFDFGDNWEFQLVLESIAPPDKKLKHARIVESRGKAPQQY